MPKNEGKEGGDPSSSRQQVQEREGRLSSKDPPAGETGTVGKPDDQVYEGKRGEEKSGHLLPAVPEEKLGAVGNPLDWTINWERRETIDVPTPEGERRIAIRLQDWKRLKNSLSRSQDEPNYTVSNLPNWYCALFGSALASLISIGVSFSPSWSLLILGIVALSSTICGFALLFAEKKLASRKESRIKELLDDMQAIEESLKAGKEEGIIR